jgi:hypothetical protein
MSKIEDIMYEAHDLGIHERVFDLVREHQQYCGSQGQWYDQSRAYDDAFKKAKEEYENLCSKKTRED